MYLNDNYYFLFLVFAIAVMFGGVFLLLSMPGTFLYLLSDYVPSIFLEEVSGGHISEAGLSFSFYWPFVTVGAYLISKLKITNIRKIAVIGEFNVLGFVVLLAMGSIGLAAILHIGALR